MQRKEHREKSRKIAKKNETSWAAGTDDDAMFERREAARRCAEQGVLAVWLGLSPPPRERHANKNRGSETKRNKMQHKERKRFTAKRFARSRNKMKPRKDQETSRSLWT